MCPIFSKQTHLCKAREEQTATAHSSGQLAGLSTARAASGLTYDVIAAKPAAPCGTTTARDCLQAGLACCLQGFWAGRRPSSYVRTSLSLPGLLGWI